jgi:limonene-1,2-epoxide hydrolase
LVRRFFLRWESSFEELCAGFQELMSEECVLVQSGFPDLKGPSTVIEFLRAGRTQQRIETISVDVVRLVSSVSCVVSERVDHLHDAKGNVLVSIPVAGIMDFRSGKIVSWREYFDSKLLDRLAQQTGQA